MAGALPRFNNNYDLLQPAAKAAAKEPGMEPVVTNPFLNAAAQAIERVHCVEDAIEIVDELLDRGIEAVPGQGCGAMDTSELDANGVRPYASG